MDREAGNLTSLDEKLASRGTGTSQSRALRSRKVGFPLLQEPERPNRYNAIEKSATVTM